MEIPMSATDNRIFVSCILCSFLLGSGLASGQSANAKLRVGTYDSRAIAVAYAQSQLMSQEFARLTQERDKAKAANDEKRVKELEALGSAQQAQLHRQAFSTASVMAILEKIKPELHAVALQANVALIVSKWEIACDDQSVQYVDVTLPLVQKFNPSPQALKMIEQLRQHDPIPQEKLPAGEGN
jgi:hypothetical protein